MGPGNLEDWWDEREGRRCEERIEIPDKELVGLERCSMEEGMERRRCFDLVECRDKSERNGCEG